MERKKKRINKIEDCFDTNYSVPRKGTIALCSRGILGIITEDSPKEISYPDGNKGKAYVGIQLGTDNIGKPWSSRDPMVIGHIDELINCMDFAANQEKRKIIAEKKDKLKRKIARRKND